LTSSAIRGEDDDIKFCCCNSCRYSRPFRLFAKQNGAVVPVAAVSVTTGVMINPLTIPSTQAHINDARAVAEHKACPFAA